MGKKPLVMICAQWAMMLAQLEAPLHYTLSRPVSVEKPALVKIFTGVAKSPQSACMNRLLQGRPGSALACFAHSGKPPRLNKVCMVAKR